LGGVEGVDRRVDRLACPASPPDLPPLFEQGGFSLSRSYGIQLGLNNVFVFAKPLS
jgi:hypothetical protein